MIRALYQRGLRPAVTRLYDPFDTYVFMQGASAKHADATAAPAPHALVGDAMRAVLNHAGGLNALL